MRKNRLIIRKKSDWCVDPDLVELYELRAKSWVAGEAIPRHPFDFHVRYYWSDRIDHEILNPTVDAAWEAPETLATSQSAGGGVRKHLLSGLRSLLSQRVRNSRIDLTSLMRCPVCKGESLRSEGVTLVCAGCGSVYPVRDGGIPDMISDLDHPPAG